MNSNSLPVALMQSLVSTVPLLKWGPEDSTNAMFGRSLTYLVVFSSLGMMVSAYDAFGRDRVSEISTIYHTFPSSCRSSGFSDQVHRDNAYCRCSR
jgi:hypothetical protein